MSQPLLSLCMIVRDEEACLERCLRSAEPLVDEIVVVDTGSRDSTIDMVRAAGARLIQREWDDDFAAARNAGLDEAGGTFVLVLDADEWIETAPHPTSFRALLESTQESAFSVEIADRLDGGGVRRRAAARLFRNRPEHRYEGAVGESITASIDRHRRNPGEELRPSGLVVEHDGLLLAQRSGLGRARRHREQLRRLIARNPDDAAVRWHLARSLVTLKDGRAVPGSFLHEGVEQLEWILSRDGFLAAEEADQATLLHGAALAALGRLDEAAKVLEDHESTGVVGELVHADVEMSLDSGDAEVPGPERALDRLRRWDASSVAVRESVHDPSVVQARIAEALLLLGRSQEARTTAERATEAPDAGASAWNALAAVECVEGRPGEAMQAHVSGLRADAFDPWAWAGLGALLLGNGQIGEAVDPLRNAAALAPGWDAVDEALATVMLLEDRADELLELFSENDEPRAGVGAQAAVILASAATGASADLERTSAGVPQAINRILSGVAAAGRPDVLQRLATGLGAAATAG